MYKACTICELDINEASRYCSHCGALQATHTATETVVLWDKLKQLSIFYALELAVCYLFSFYKPMQTLLGLCVVSLISVITTCFFVKVNWHIVKNALRWPKLSIIKILLYRAIAIGSSVFVHYTVGWLNQYLFHEDISYYAFFIPYRHSIILLILFVAVYPAIFEELAYRGYLLQLLNTVVGKQQAILISSFLFAIIHLSLISLYWLVPLALLLGYVCTKEDTIWYGVIIHFAFNLTGCMLELYDYGIY